MRLQRGLFLLGVACVVHAQDKPATQAPDREAYKQAVRHKDTRERLDALHKFVRDYPKSSRTGPANELILKTLVQNWPDQTGQLADQVKVMMRGVRGDDQIDQFDTIADILVTNKVLLETAEKLERQALNRFDDKRFRAKIKREYAEAKVPVSAREVQQISAETRADLLTTMGRIHIARGDTPLGQSLLQQAYKLDPGNSLAAAALGEIALRAGHESDALDLLARAQLNGMLSVEQRKNLRDLYRRLHAGSPDGLAEWIDRMYRQKFPEAFHVDPYASSAGRGKTVLAELFTGAGCAPCAGFDVAMDAAMERYSKSDLAVLMYHEHIPEPDPLANPSTVQRLSFYDVRGTPTLEIDGEAVSGGGTRDAAEGIFERVSPKIEAELKTSPVLSLALTGSREGQRVTVHARVDPLSNASKSMRLEIALVEKQIRYSGQSGIRFHPMVVRAMAGQDENGFAIDPSGPKVYDATFDISEISAALKSYLDGYELENDRFGPIQFSEKKDLIDDKNLAIVAFVQDSATKRVLQASYLEPDASAVR